MKFRMLFLRAVVTGLAGSGWACAATHQGPAAAHFLLPASIQLPFEPDPELLVRLRQTRCWSEFRLFDPKSLTLGEVIALEWYDTVDSSVSRLYLRVDGKQLSFRRQSLSFVPPSAKTAREATGEAGPDRVGTRWVAAYLPKGKATMEVIEGDPDADEHISTGMLALAGVLSRPVSVAHSAGCDHSGSTARND